MQIRKIISVLLCASMLFALAACNPKTEETAEATSEVSESTEASSEETTTKSTQPTVTETTAVIDGLYDPNNPNAVNPVTGVQDMNPLCVGNRIIGVSVNNYYESFPQRGISTADAIFEFETEAGKTRFVALFADLDQCPEIGSMRSGRYVSTDLCMSINAVFLYWGANELVKGYMKSVGLDYVDGNMCSASFYSADENGDVELPKNCFFWREQDWKNSKKYENTGVSNGTYLKASMEKYEIDPKGDAPLLFNFVKGENASLANAQDCAEVNVYFSSAVPDSNFKYDASKGLYMKSAKGQPQVDETTGEQIGFTNVFVVFANIHQKDSQPDLRDASFTEGGTGYYLSNGKIVNFTWTQENKTSPFKYFTEDGQELQVNIGKSFICIVDNDVQDKTTVYSTVEE